MDHGPIGSGIFDFILMTCQGDGVAEACRPLRVRSEPARQWSPRSSVGSREKVHLRDPGRHSLHPSIQNTTKTTFVSSHQGGGPSVTNWPQYSQFLSFLGSSWPGGDPSQERSRE